MRYKIEYLKDDQVVQQNTGDDGLLTVESAVALGVILFSTINANLEATWFRVLDDQGNVVAKWPEGS